MNAPTFIVVHDPWQLHPLAWIHRREASQIAAELRRSGHIVQRASFGPSITTGSDGNRRILRVSDPVMRKAVEALTMARVPYIGPGLEAMKRCYDKYEASRLVAAAGLTCPQTELGTAASRIDFSAVGKPRWGSDSIGVRHYANGAVPARKRNERYVIQRYIRGTEMTIAVLNGEAGAPLHIRVPEGALYTFARKYLLRPQVVPLMNGPLVSRVRAEALQIAATLGVDWAARIDFIHQPDTDLLYFLECDVAPLVGLGSAFDTSLRNAGLAREQQLQGLLLADQF